MSRLQPVSITLFLDGRLSDDEIVGLIEKSYARETFAGKPLAMHPEFPEHSTILW